MKLFTIGAVVLFMSILDVQATEVKIGGGMIFEHTIPGGVLAIDVPIPHKPLAISFSADYFKGSGHTSVPVSIKGLFRTHLGPKTAVYLGVGGGVVYSKSEATSGATTTTGSHLRAKAAVAGSHSSTDALAAAVAGLDVPISSNMGVFIEVSLDRALVSGAKNEVAAKGGVFFGLGHKGHKDDSHH